MKKHRPYPTRTRGAVYRREDVRLRFTDAGGCEQEIRPWSRDPLDVESPALGVLGPEDPAVSEAERLAYLLDGLPCS